MTACLILVAFFIFSCGDDEDNGGGKADGDQTIKADGDQTITDCEQIMAVEGCHQKIETSSDYDCDGEILKFCYTYTYDANGNILIRQYDQDCDGTLDQCISHTYDASDNWLTGQYFNARDGDSSKSCYTNIYDANDLLTQKLTDERCDGSIDDCHNYRYDESGNELQIRVWWDWDCDGISDKLCTSSTYDANGLLLSEEFQLICDLESRLPLIICYSYIFDATGSLLTQKLFDENCDGSIDACLTHIYSENGNLLSVQSDENCDGSTETCHPYTYHDCD